MRDQPWSRSDPRNDAGGKAIQDTFGRRTPAKSTGKTPTEAFNDFLDQQIAGVAVVEMEASEKALEVARKWGVVDENGVVTHEEVMHNLIEMFPNTEETA